MPHVINLAAKLLLLTILLIGGCASLPPEKVTHKTKAEHHDILSHLLHWTAQGRLGVKHPGQSFSASFTWSQNNDHYEILILNPFGQTQAKIEGTKYFITLSENGQTQRFKDPQNILLNSLGWSFPIQHSQYWIKGIPNPTTPYTVITQTPTTLTQFTQSNWDIEYQRFQTVQGMLLPEKIILKNNTTRIRIVIHNWELNL